MATTAGFTCSVSHAMRVGMVLKLPKHISQYRLPCAAAATSIIQQQEAAKAAGLDGIDRVPEAALADAVTSASVQQLRQDMLSLIQENAGQAC